MSIVLARVDDRLIHGQVVTSWVAFSGGKRIVIVDDGTANDPFMTNVCKKLAPMGTTVEVYDIESSIDVLNECMQDDGIKALVLVRFPQTVLACVERGVPFEELIVGGMGMRGKRKKLYRNISADDEERAAMKRLDELGCKVYARILPKDKPVDVATLL